MSLDGSSVSEGFRWRDCGLRFAIVASSLGPIGVWVSFGWNSIALSLVWRTGFVRLFQWFDSSRLSRVVTLSYSNLHQYSTPDAPIQTCKCRIQEADPMLPVYHTNLSWRA